MSDSSRMFCLKCQSKVDLILVMGVTGGIRDRGRACRRGAVCHALCVDKHILEDRRKEARSERTNLKAQNNKFKRYTGADLQGGQGGGTAPLTVEPAPPATPSIFSILKQAIAKTNQHWMNH